MRKGQGGVGSWVELWLVKYFWGQRRAAQPSGDGMRMHRRHCMGGTGGNLLGGIDVNVLRGGGSIFRATGNGTHGTGGHGSENGDFDEFHNGCDIDWGCRSRVPDTLG